MPGSVVPLGLDGYEAIAVPDRMHARPGPELPLQAGAEGLRRVECAQSLPDRPWEPVIGELPRLGEAFPERRVRLGSLGHEQAQPSLG